MFSTTPINGRARGGAGMVHGRPANVPSQPLRRVSGIDSSAIPPRRSSRIQQQQKQEDDEDELIPRTPKREQSNQPHRRLYKDTPIPQRERELEEQHEASYDITVPILPPHEYDEEKQQQEEDEEIEHLEEEYSNILDEDYGDDNDNDNNDNDNDINTSLFQRRKNKPHLMDTSSMMLSSNKGENNTNTDDEDRNPVLIYLVDPVSAFFKRGITIGFLTLRFLISPFLQKRVLSFIFMTLVMIFAVALSSIGVFYGLKYGKNLIVSYSSSSSSSSSNYHPPKFVPENMDEWSDRLINVEREVESLSRISSSLQAGVKDSTENSRLRMDRLDEELQEAIQGLSKLSSDFSVVNKQVDEYSTMTEQIQSRFKELSNSLGDLQKVVAGQESETSDMKTTITQHGDAISSSIEAIQKSAKEIETLQNRLRYLEQAQMGEQSVMELLEEYLPSRMVVSVDPHTKSINGIPEFWSFLDNILQEKFSNILDNYEFERGSGQQQPSNINWEDFLKLNEQALRSLIQDENNYISNDQYSMVSKEEFQQVLQYRLSEFREDISQKLENLDHKVRWAIEHDNAVEPDHTTTGIALETLVRDQIEAYNSKTILAKPDYASKVNGAQVDRPNTSKTYSPHSSRSLVYRLARGVTSLVGFGRVILNPPEVALNEDTTVGSCWPFNGQSGKLGVVLASEIYPTDISIEHIPAKITLNPATAPKTITVWMQIKDESNRKMIRDIISQPSESSDIPTDYVKILSFNYNVYSNRRAQLVSIPYAVQKIAGSTSKVIIDIGDNWGNPFYTCLYKIRVYGDTERQQQQSDHQGHSEMPQQQPDPDTEGDDSFGDDEIL